MESEDNGHSVSKTSLHDYKSTEVTGSDQLEPDEEQHAETLVERLNLLRPDNPYREFDERTHAIHQGIEVKFQNAPKTVLDETEENKPLLEKRLEHIDTEMADLLAYGNEIVTNIKVANEKRELFRREFELQQLISLENSISKESTETLAKYNDIAARWSELGELTEPMAMFQKLEQQKDNIMELMLKKEDMIEKCQQEIDRMDQFFEEQLAKQQTDICATVERVNAQVNLLKQAYSHHMSLLQDTLESERHTIALKEQEKWSKFYDTAQNNERYKVDMTKEKKLFYTNEIRRITTQQEEITRTTRIRLEKEAELLDYELQNTKNRMIMNSEKLDYNYQVLQKRNEENVIINNQQKRRVGKLNEALVDIRKRIKSTQANSENSISKFTIEIQKLHDSITELEKKNDRFRLHNRKKFLSIWDTCFQDIKTLVERVFCIDRVLHEQQLGLPWQKPALELEEFEFVKKEKAALFGDACSVNSECGNSGESIKQSALGKFTSYSLTNPQQSFRKRQRETLIRKAEDERRSQEQRAEKRLLRNILRKVADLGGFLVEDRLLEFLEPYAAGNRALVRIDNIFAALRITDMAAVNKLVEFFKPYAWCPNCMKGIPRENLKKLYRPCGLLGADDDDDDDISNGNNNGSFESIDETMSTMKTLLPSTKESVTPSATAAKILAAENCDNHYLTVESAMVLTALNEFTNHEAKSFEEESKRHYTLRASKAISGSTGAKSRPSISSIDINDEIICEYWRKFQDYMPKEKLYLWQSLEHGLKHYLDVLKLREQLDKDCVALRRQNAELKHLLQKFEF